MMPAMQSTYQGELSFDEPMSKHTSWRAGGLAEKFYRPVNSVDLVAFLQSLDPTESVFMLGLGSNLLVRDGGIKGTVVAMKGCLNEIQLLDNHCLEVDAGVSCAKVARFAARNGLVGAEFLAGIPGTMGGALAMNAGAFGRETWDVVKLVNTIDHAGAVVEREQAEFEVSYRQVQGLEGAWFLSAQLQLETGDTKKSQADIKVLLEKRNQSQPIGLPSCGSVFRNPENDFAARLIEQCGLKGFCIGAACVSKKHANFIINTGDANSTDIEALIYHIQDRVKSETGVVLQMEVHMVGMAND